LANYAQSIGVHIYHTGEITKENIGTFGLTESTFATLVVDATGKNQLVVPGAKSELRNGYTLPDTYISFTGKDIVKSTWPLYSACTDFGDGEYTITSPQGDAYYAKYAPDSSETPSKENVVKVMGDGNRITIDLCNPSAPFTVTCGNLVAKEALGSLQVGNTTIPVYAVGDTYMRTNFMNGNGVYFGFMLSLFLAVQHSLCS
jgi:hypothetical protein